VFSSMAASVKDVRRQNVKDVPALDDEGPGGPHSLVVSWLPLDRGHPPDKREHSHKMVFSRLNACSNLSKASDEMLALNTPIFSVK